MKAAANVFTVIMLSSIFALFVALIWSLLSQI